VGIIERCDRLHLDRAEAPLLGELNKTGNVRNATTSKTMLRESARKVGTEILRDQAGTSEPQVADKVSADWWPPRPVVARTIRTMPMSCLAGRAGTTLTGGTLLAVD
jgi:hypothetical protein